jgi:hypothetical protein
VAENPPGHLIDLPRMLVHLPSGVARMLVERPAIRVALGELTELRGKDVGVAADGHLTGPTLRGGWHVRLANTMFRLPERPHQADSGTPSRRCALLLFAKRR